VRFVVQGQFCIFPLEKTAAARINCSAAVASDKNQAHCLPHLQIPISISLSDSGWTLALEQILIFVLVMGKWIGPKGEMSRSELSQLLLVNIAAGADIIELLEVFGEDKVMLAFGTKHLQRPFALWTYMCTQFLGKVMCFWFLSCLSSLAREFLTSCHSIQSSGYSIVFGLTLLPEDCLQYRSLLCIVTFFQVDCFCRTFDFWVFDIRVQIVTFGIFRLLPLPKC